MLRMLTLIVVCSLSVGRCSLENLDDDDDHGRLLGVTSSAHVIVFPSSEGDDDGVGELCDDTALQCIPLSGCEIASHEPRRADSKRAFPKICGWEVAEPKVCCMRPANNSEQSTIADQKTKLFDQFDKIDCAVTTVNASKDVPSASRWPFTVAIFIVLGGEKIFLCGGSLVSRTIVLTAAHCFENRIETDVYVVQMGTAELNPSSALVRELAVTEVIVHEDFVPPALDNDVAILKLAGPEMNYSDTIRPVCLPDFLLDESNMLVNVIGWGSKEFGGASNQVLQKVVLREVSNVKCNETYSAIAAAKAALPNGIKKTQLCARDANGVKDACQGDPGGPLVVTDNSLRWVQVGIVSGGIGCGIAGVPGIYSRVSQYLEWIRSK